MPRKTKSRKPFTKLAARLRTARISGQPISSRRPKTGGAPRRKKKSSGAAARFGSGVGRMIGDWIAPGIAGPVGGALGSGLGTLFSKITGIGDYKVQSNSLVKSSPVPSFGENCIHVKHKEYLGDITSSTAFSSLSFDINPGLASSFPWLSAVASNYQEYAFLGLVYTYVSTSADALNSTNTALGKIAMATDYNAINPSYTSVVQMLATEFSNYGKPNLDLMHAVECAPGMRPTLLQYVRTGPVPANADERLYDLGNFQIAAQGMQATANIGGLWATYDIMLCKPVIAPAAAPIDHWYTSAMGTTNILANGTANTSTSPIGCTLNNGIITFPTSVAAGKFKITCTVLGDGKSITNYASPILSVNGMGQTSPGPLGGGTIAIFDTETGVTGNFCHIAYYTITGTGAFITTHPFASTAGLPMDFYIEKLSS